MPITAASLSCASWRPGLQEAGSRLLCTGSACSTCGMRTVT
nr:MAG TPA: Protein of unknown function (DUF2752) [Caudoviricetes sp.]